MKKRAVWKGNGRKMLPGSSTLEAALVLPLFFFLILLLLKTGFSLKAQVEELAATLLAQQDTEARLSSCLSWIRMTGMLKTVIQ